MVRFKAAQNSICNDFTTQFFLKNNTWTGEILDVKSYWQISAKEELELRKTPIILSNKFNPLLFETYARNKKQIFPNWIFYLTRGQPDQSVNGKTPEVVWIAYKHAVNSLTSYVDVIGSIAIHPTKKTAYIVLISDGFTTPKLEIYETEINKNIASFPLELDQETYINWTPAGQPLAEREVKIGISCSVEQIDLEMSGERLVVIINRNSKSCESKKIFYDLAGGNWSDT